MTKYNMGQKAENNYKLTITELCDEIAEENIEMEHISNDTLRDKFSNNDKTGIIDKLESKLHFSINDFGEQYNKLKLLKMIYYIEKNGVNIKDNKDFSNTKIRIIDVLNKPRLDNIENDFSLVSQYGKILEKIKEEVEKEVDKDIIKNKKERLESLNTYWEVIIDKLLDYVITDKSLEDTEETMKELNRIENFLSEKILAKLAEIPNIKLSYKENLMCTFYNMLLCHELACNEADRVNINYQIHIDERPSDEYVECFVKYEEYIVKKDMMQMISDVIDKKVDNADAHRVLFLINKGKELDVDRGKKIKFALKYIEIIFQWFRKFKNIDNVDGYYLSWFITIIQEIIFVKENDERLKNDYYGNKYTNKPLLSALKKPMDAPAIYIKAWIKKIENRYAINLGAYNLIQKKNSIENIISKIKEKIFTYKNLDDLEDANKFIIHFVARCLVSRQFSMNVGNKFAYKVAEKTRYDKFNLFDNAVNVFDMFREFLICSGSLEKVANDVSDIILEFDRERSNVIARRFKYKFNINLNSYYNRNFIFLFWVNRNNKSIDYDNFFEIIDDKEIEEIIRLGLEKFVIR